jgi:adenosine deaminase
MTDLRKMPKIELHRHLEGSVRPSTILEIAREHGLPLPADTLDELKDAIYVREPAESIQQIFEKFHLAQQSFVGPEEIRRITREVVEDAAADEVRLLELRFSPSFMTEVHSIPWDEVLEAVSLGTEEAKSEKEIEVGLVIICSRDLGVNLCDETVEFCLEHQDRIVGLDLAGDETSWPARLFASSFRRAAQAGLKITVHAGEVGSPSEVEDALTLLHAHRIGHGVRIAESPALLRDIVAQKIPLELCPTSNWITRSSESLASHPLPRFLQEGAVVTISSDDPEIFEIDLTHEYEVCTVEMGLTTEDIALCNRHALSASFLPEESRKRVARLL